MKKEYSKYLKEQFKQRLSDIAPEYQEIKIANPIYPGQATYQWKAREKIYCFITLVPNPKGLDTYTFEIGWSTLARFPKIEGTGSWITIHSLTPDRSEFNLSECIIRLGNVYSSKDKWWPIGDNWDILKMTFDDIVNPKKIPKEKAISDVNKNLDEVIPLLAQYGLPLLKEFVSSRTNSL